ncbi:hypothetical protein E5288_WYG012822 [Bos mutus]|uniref:Uncharacterized protein n=1 Tax=Bos mutus TaxID=72004 RepID=A0A6B0QTD6_9CETA|nr:hypothetical protein [Bos mutus]
MGSPQGLGVKECGLLLPVLLDPESGNQLLLSHAVPSLVSPISCRHDGLAQLRLRVAEGSLSAQVRQGFVWDSQSAPCPVGMLHPHQVSTAWQGQTSGPLYALLCILLCTQLCKAPNVLSQLETGNTHNRASMVPSGVDTAGSLSRRLHLFTEATKLLPRWIHGLASADFFTSVDLDGTEEG